MTYDSFYSFGILNNYSLKFNLININEKILGENSFDMCAAPGGKSFQILSKKRNLTLCINCFFVHKECSEKEGQTLIAYLSRLNNLSLILDKTHKKNSNT